jgi:hypothetical protein
MHAHVHVGTYIHLIITENVTISMMMTTIATIII